MFRSTMNKGFQMTFSNGCTVSVQYGTANYCDRPSEQSNPFAYGVEMAHPKWEAKNAEIAAWDSDSRWWDFGNDTVLGYCTPDQVADFIKTVQTKGIMHGPTW